MRFVQLNPFFIGRPPGLQQTERQLFPVFMWIKPLDLRDFRISKPRRFAPSKPRVLSIPGANSYFLRNSVGTRGHPLNLQPDLESRFSVPRKFLQSTKY